MAAKNSALASAPILSDMSIEPIQSSTIVVIHPGSMFLRLGRASDAFPHVIPHVIAKRNLNNASPCHFDSPLVPLIDMSPEVAASMDELQNAIRTVLAACKTNKGSTRITVPLQNVIDHNMSIKPKVAKAVSEVSWTKLNETKNFVIGEEALYVNPCENFNIHWPIRRGQLHLHSGVGGSLTSILSDLELIWGSAIQQYLEIPLKDLKKFRAVLVIPDVYKREHVKALVDLLLTQLGFASCFVHLESVCATFGSGLSYACVVDTGDQKTAISCVEDGISHRSTRLCIEYGGSDISQLFHQLQSKCFLPYHFSLDSVLDCLTIRDLKELFCHINLEVSGAQEQSFFVKKPNVPTLQYTIKVGDECIIAPMALFHPDLFGITGPKKVLKQQRSTGDPEDPFDDAYLIQTQRRGTKDVSEGPTEQTTMDENHINSSVLDEDADSTDPPTNLSLKETEPDLLCEQQLLSIDQAILKSIESCDSEELKRKMYSCILVVGGGMMFSGIQRWLQSRLSAQVPVAYRSEHIEIVTRPKDMDPRITVWKGAAIMCCLDTAQELWISHKEWLRYSVKLLRERAPFSW